MNFLASMVIRSIFGFQELHSRLEMKMSISFGNTSYVLIFFFKKGTKKKQCHNSLHKYVPICLGVSEDKKEPFKMPQLQQNPLN